MQIYRVVISFMRENMQFMYERSALAMTPGQALDDVVSNLKIQRAKVHSLKTWVNRPEQYTDFSLDARLLPVINSDQRLDELWRRKYGDK